MPQAKRPAPPRTQSRSPAPQPRPEPPRPAPRPEAPRPAPRAAQPLQQAARPSKAPDRRSPAHAPTSAPTHPAARAPAAPRARAATPTPTSAVHHAQTGARAARAPKKEVPARPPSARGPKAVRVPATKVAHATASDVSTHAKPGKWYQVGATYFSGCPGYYRNLCDGRFYYAELGRVINGRHTPRGNLARALGLPGVITPPGGLWIEYGGKTTYAEIGDIGYGQGNQGAGQPSDPHYAIDLHDNLAKWLGFPGKGDVRISPNFPAPGRTSSPGPSQSVAQQVRQLYFNPLAHAHVRAERIDQGVDYAGTGYLVAIADGVVTQSVANGSGWEKEGYLEYKITQPGELDGVHIYYAEGVTPVVHVGERVRGGARVADLKSYQPHGIELGFAAGNGEQSYYAYHDGAYDGKNATRPGVAFSNLVKRLGGPGGVIEYGVVGRFPEYMQSGEPSGYVNASTQQVAAGGGAEAPTDAAGMASDVTWPGDYYSAFVQIQRGSLNGSHHTHSAYHYAKGVEYVKPSK